MIKKKYTILLVGFISIFLVLNFLTPIPYPKTKTNTPTSMKPNSIAKYTYISYVCADNNLEKYGRDDVNEMEAGYNDSITDVHLISLLDVLNGGTTAYYISHDDQANTITSTVVNVEGLTSEENMGDPNTLFTFVNWCMTYYPAENYVLDLWDHGSGWAVCFDESSNDDALTMAELRSVLEDLNATSGNLVDILSMDACLMGTFEVAYELRDLVSILVASEDAIIAAGFPYDDIIEDLCTDPDQNITEFANTMVNLFHDSMLFWSSTLSAVNLPLLNSNLYPAFATLAENLYTYLDTGIKNELYNARGASQEFYHPEFIDLYDLIENIKIEASNATIKEMAQDVLDNFTTIIINEKHNGNPGAHGLSIYFPELYSGYLDAYHTFFSSSNHTFWDEFLVKYYTSANFGLGLRYYVINDSLGNADNTPDPGETLLLDITLENIGDIEGGFINGTLTCSDIENVTILDGRKGYGNISISTSGTQRFTFNISNTCSNFHVLQFVLTTEAVFSNYSVARNFTFELIVGLEITLGGATLQTATEITVGFTYGILPGLGSQQESWLKINCTQGDYLFLNLTGPEFTDFDAYVYNPLQVLTSVAGKADYPDECSFLLMHPGYYYIKIDPFSGFGYFTLFANFTNEPYEDGSFYGLAYTLAGESITNGTLPGPAANNYIYYRVIVQTDQQLEVTLEGPIGTDFDIYIYSPKLEQIAKSTSPYSLEKCRIIARNSGYHYIVVVPYTGTGEFTLEVEVKDVPFPIWLLVILISLLVLSIGVAIAYYLFNIRRQRVETVNYDVSDIGL